MSKRTWTDIYIFNLMDMTVDWSVRPLHTFKSNDTVWIPTTLIMIDNLFLIMLRGANRGRARRPPFLLSVICVDCYCWWRIWQLSLGDGDGERKAMLAYCFFICPAGLLVGEVDLSFQGGHKFWVFA